MDLETAIRAMPSDLAIVIIGGIATQRYLPAYTTNDLDVCYERTADNWQRVIQWLAPFHPRLWINQQERALIWDATTPAGEYTLLTDAGEIDVLYEVDGLGPFPVVLSQSDPIMLFGRTMYLLSLKGLITSKRAVNRPKDRLVLQQLERL